jgi:hypothetical protein
VPAGRRSASAALSDHRPSESIYPNDPDGNGLELFVDADPARAGGRRRSPRRDHSVSERSYPFPSFSISFRESACSRERRPLTFRSEE